MQHCTDDPDASVVVYELSPSEPPSEGVVAAASDCDPVAPDDLTPLATVIDPDALDSLFQTVGSDADRGDGEVRFRYHGHAVTVDRDGRITVAPADAAD